MAENMKEIDLVGIAREVWRRKWKAVKYGVTGFVVGFVIVIFSATQYTASTIFVAQGDASSMDLSNLSGLAAMAGLSGALPTKSQSTLSPKLYPKVVAASSFMKELMYKTVDSKRSATPVTLYDYMTQTRYRSFSLGKVIRSILPERERQVDSLTIMGAEYDLFAMTKREAMVAKALTGLVSVTLDEKNGYIKVSACMPEALVAAQVATEVVDMLQRYITNFKLEKANQKLDFIQKRYEEIKANYYGKLSEVSYFRDTHRNQATEVARMQEQKLTDEYNIVYSLFTDVSKQLEQAKIDVKKDTPIFTVIDPIIIPTKKSAPRALVITFIFAILGGLIVVGQVAMSEMKKEED